jgi:hypothetical protein
MKAFRIFTVLLLISFLLNYASRKSLPFAYADVADYNLLYTSSDNIYVKKLEVINDSLDILFGGAVKEVNNYAIAACYSGKARSIDSNARNISYTGKSLRYKPPPGKPEIITVSVNNSPHPFSLNVSFTPESVYKKAGNSNTLTYEVTSADIAIEPALVRSLSDWVPDDWEQDKRIPFAQVQQFLRDSTGILETDSTTQKILKIGAFVLARTRADDGLPSDKIAGLHPLHQLREAQAGRANFWCGNYTALFGCLAAAAGIQARTVFTGSSKEKLGLGNHAFSEAYIPEKKCWAYVDLTNNTILLQQANKYLNVIDVQRLMRYPAGIDAVSSYSFSGESMRVVPFRSMSSRAQHYFHHNTFFTFFYNHYFDNFSRAGYGQRIKNLFLTRPLYAVYSDNLPGRNYHLFARIFSNYFFASIAIIWLLMLVVIVVRLVRKRVQR